MIKLNKTDLARVRQIVVMAGNRLLNYAHPDPIRQKYADTLISVVTKADVETEKFLRQELKKYFPSVGFYSEETYQDFGEELKKDYVWVVDPIDGTLNFSRGLPLFGVTLALFYKKRPVYGVIYMPKLNEYYHAVKDKGAFLNGQKIFVRESDSFKKLFGAGGFTYGQALWSKFIDLRYRFNFEFCRAYCAVYDYANTASGKYNFSLTLGSAIWDVAAGWILVEEAGGIFNVFSVDEDRKRKGNPYHLWCLAGPKNVVNFLKPEVVNTILKP